MLLTIIRICVGIAGIGPMADFRSKTNVYVCICKSVTDKQIRRAAARGVDNLYDLRESLGVSAGCGSCAATAQDILDEAHAHHAAPTLYVPSSA